MTKERKHVALQLTESQKAQVKAATGKDAEIVELSVEELEERIAPAKGVGPSPHFFVGPQL